MEERTQGKVSLGLLYIAAILHRGKRGRSNTTHRLETGRTHSYPVCFAALSDALVNIHVCAQFVRPAVHLSN